MESIALASWLEAAHASVHPVLAGDGSSFAVLVGHGRAEPLARDVTDEGGAAAAAAYDVFCESALDQRERAQLLATGPVGTFARAVEGSLHRLQRCGVADVAYVAAGDPAAVACFVASAKVARRRMPRHRRTQLEHAAVRLSVGCRMLAQSSGSAVDLRRVAQDAERDGRGRLDGARAWAELVGGILSPVDGFDAGGRRYVVARPPERRGAVSRSLSGRELAVVELAARGYANKHIAFELGIAEQSVSTYLARARAKLGVTSRVELICLVRSAAHEDA